MSEEASKSPLPDIFSSVEAFVKETSRCIFLTGKAGTGKTTFLKYIKDNSFKKTIVVAPTGVAAIHAGGTTLHSFFQLPFSPFIPGTNTSFSKHEEWSDQYALLKNIRIEAEKRALFREMELLIIDEVSMVRCDVLDAIDVILRFFRRRPFDPFGGVQVLFIGDLFQLPPVVPDEEWRLLSQFYESPFFFHAKVMQYCKPLYLELKKIFRQRDPEFISLLNNIRINDVDENDLALLNSKYNGDFNPSKAEHYVTLTSHNHKADTINQKELADLPGKEFHFEASVEGDFGTRLFPTERLLTLKEGSQIMFIKNDMERVRRYYNGKIGTIKSILDDQITVTFPGEETELIVEKDTWKNIRYNFNPTTRQIEEEIIGTFTQFAIRLAWAITIHKSQGLTFDKIVVDAGQSFASGQVYVALSRCTSLEGIVLKSKIFRNSIRTDERVMRFSETETEAATLQSLLVEERLTFMVQTLIRVFDLEAIHEGLSSLQEFVGKKKIAAYAKAQSLTTVWLTMVDDEQAVAQKFQLQLKRIAESKDYGLLKERIESGANYFVNSITQNIFLPLQQYQDSIKGKSQLKKYKKALDELESLLRSQLECFEKCKRLVNELECEIKKANPVYVSTNRV